MVMKVISGTSTYYAIDGVVCTPSEVAAMRD